MQSLARNHALVGGERRMAWAATKLFLRFNGFALRASAADVGERFVLDVVAGSLAMPDMTQRLTDWFTPVR
jgi:death-on-curing protein